MFRRVLLIVLIAAMTVAFTACAVEIEDLGGMVSGAVKEYNESVDLSDKYKSDEPIEVNLDLIAAKAILGSTDEKLVDARFLYSSEAFKPEFTVKDDEISITGKADKYNTKKLMNQWEVKLTDRIPLKVKLDAEVSDLKLNFSKMAVNDLDVSLDASTANLYFDEPNSEKIEKLELDANASNGSLYNLGNSGFEKLDIKSTASKMNIDLTGKYERNGEARIEANASTLKLKLPEGLGVRIVIDQYELSTVKINNDNILSRSDREFVTKNYEAADKTLVVYVDLNVTTLTIE
ncbi:MAG: toast rack family protein [Caulobacteraceae bacterium]